MSPRERWDEWGPPPPKRPPPERGIKMKKAGKTWWGERWVRSLERMSAGYSNRLGRGRTYARAGRTHDVEVSAGVVRAKVTGSRVKPYRVTITLAPLADAVWIAAIAALARQAQFTAQLLAGQMPQEIDEAFHEAGASLFPQRENDLTTDCSCPDWANPCKHVAATHYVLGEAFDRDPFLLFELRGRSKEQVLAALRAARAADDEAQVPAEGAAGPEPPEIGSTTLATMTAEEFETPRMPLPKLHLTFESDPAAGGLLRQLGNPPGWALEESVDEVLGPLVREAAARARSKALG